MAVSVIDEQSVGKLRIFHGTGDPRTALGVKAEIGSLFLANDTGDLYKKTGLLDTDWTLLETSSITGPRTISHAYQNNGNAFAETASGSYTVMSHFIFQGSTLLGTPTRIDSLHSGQLVGTTYSIRIYDTTNALVIAESTGLGGSTLFSISALGSLGNIPAGASVFEVQLKKDSGGGQAHLAGISIVF